MQMITASVGQGGSSVGTDSALVQVMLMKITRPLGPPQPPGPYLSSYDGDCGRNHRCRRQSLSGKVPAGVI